MYYLLCAPTIYASFLLYLFSTFIHCKEIQYSAVEIKSGITYIGKNFEIVGGDG